MDLVKINNNEISIDINIANKLRDFYKQKTLMDIKEKKLKEELKKAMIDNSIKEWNMELEEGYIKATLKDSYTKKSIDNDKLKEDGLYDKYLKETAVKESLILDIC